MMRRCRGRHPAAAEHVFGKSRAAPAGRGFKVKRDLRGTGSRGVEGGRKQKSAEESSTPQGPGQGPERFRRPGFRRAADGGARRENTQRRCWANAPLPVEAKVALFFTLHGSDLSRCSSASGRPRRVREMFEQAEKSTRLHQSSSLRSTPRRHRGGGLAAVHDGRRASRRSTAGWWKHGRLPSGNEGIIVIAATNRPDVLDPARLRPGASTAKVGGWPLPGGNVSGREQIRACTCPRCRFGR